METHIRKQQDTLSAATVADWANSHRRNLIMMIGGALFGILVVVIGIVVYNSRSEAAQTEFGKAMMVYDTPVAVPGQPVPPGTKTYSTNAERAKEANAAFNAVADKYGATTSGKNAAYMAGVTAIETGQTQTAETQLKKVADGWDKDRASLANLALAHLYEQTGRDSDAIALYDKMTKNPTNAVPAGLAQLQLASLYEAENKPAEAKKIYAALKDADKKGETAIGDMASRKLSGQDVTQ